MGPHDEHRLCDRLVWGHPELGALAAQRPSPRSSRTGRLARTEHQGHEGAASVVCCSCCRPVFQAATRSYEPSSQNHKIPVHLPGRASPLARFTGLHAQPVGELLRKRAKLAGPRRHLEVGLHLVEPHILADGVAQQACAPLDLGRLIPRSRPWGQRRGRSTDGVNWALRGMRLFIACR